MSHAKEKKTETVKILKEGVEALRKTHSDLPLTRLRLKQDMLII